ncbi:hypothetical protein LZ32DRAFT_359930 [Colletotrichum eremochloae]|nr:hypothetical protein LZ32DRAFT_359930 [Colletotrichum eremochloae]
MACSRTAVPQSEDHSNSHCHRVKHIGFNSGHCKSVLAVNVPRCFYSPNSILINSHVVKNKDLKSSSNAPSQLASFKPVALIIERCPQPLTYYQTTGGTMVGLDLSKRSSATARLVSELEGSGTLRTTTLHNCRLILFRPTHASTPWLAMSTLGLLLCCCNVSWWPWFELKRALKSIFGDCKL